MSSISKGLLRARRDPFSDRHIAHVEETLPPNEVAECIGDSALAKNDACTGFGPQDRTLLTRTTLTRNAPYSMSTFGQSAPADLRGLECCQFLSEQIGAELGLQEL